MNRMSYRGQSGTVPGGPLGKARMALATGRTDAAEGILRKRLEQKPDDTSARILLAQMLLQTRQTGEAIEEARRAVREQPKNVDALLLLSAALVQQGGMRVPAEAEQFARRAVQLQPKLARAHVQMAEVLTAKRDFKAARIEADEAVRLEPRNAAGHLMRAVVLLSEGDALGAIQASDAALRYDRTLAQAEFIRANALKEAKRYDEALTALDTAAKQNAALGGPNLHSLRGSIFFRQRKISRAYGEFVSAQRMTGRLLRFTPVLAAVNMVLSIFGSNAAYVLALIVAVLVVLILLGISFIPVAGPWINAALVLAIVGFFGIAGVRYTRGSVLPADPSAKVFTAGAMLVAGIVGFAIVGAIEYALTSSVFHTPGGWFNPLTFTIAGAGALIAAALAAYLWPTTLGRYLRSA